jgi:hypothetical protein
MYTTDQIRAAGIAGEISSIDVGIEIKKYNYWEHFKVEKELSLILPVDHKKRIKIRETMEKLLSEINLKK